jgi:alpha-L-fucosidase
MGLNFDQPQKINCIVLKEDLLNGQNCIAFKIRLMNKQNEVIKEIDGTTIGHKRIITFPETEASMISLSVVKQKGATTIFEIETYLIDNELIEK